MSGPVFYIKNLEMRSVISPPLSIYFRQERESPSSVSHHPFLMHIPACSAVAVDLAPWQPVPTHLGLLWNRSKSTCGQGNFSWVYHGATSISVLLVLRLGCSQSSVTSRSSFPPTQTREVGACHSCTCCRHPWTLWVVPQPHSLDKLEGRGWKQSSSLKPHEGSEESQSIPSGLITPRWG